MYADPSRSLKILSVSKLFKCFTTKHAVIPQHFAIVADVFYLVSYNVTSLH